MLPAVLPPKACSRALSSETFRAPISSSPRAAGAGAAVLLLPMMRTTRSAFVPDSSRPKPLTRSTSSALGSRISLLRASGAAVETARLGHASAVTNARPAGMVAGHSVPSSAVRFSRQPPVFPLRSTLPPSD